MSGRPGPEGQDQVDLSEGLARAGLGLHRLWLQQLAVGGDAGVTELDAYLHGALTLSPHQHDVLAQALNDHFRDVGDLTRVRSDGASSA